MADTTEVAGKAAAIPTHEELDRVERFTREPFAPDADALRPGTARRRAFDAALAEIEAGREEPSIEWRQQYSLMLGLERLLAEDEPGLVDGTVLSPIRWMRSRARSRP
jgi:ribonuclease E